MSSVCHQRVLHHSLSFLDTLWRPSTASLLAVLRLAGVPSASSTRFCRSQLSVSNGHFQVQHWPSKTSLHRPLQTSTTQRSGDGPFQQLPEPVHVRHRVQLYKLQHQQSSAEGCSPLLHVRSFILCCSLPHLPRPIHSSENASRSSVTTKASLPSWPYFSRLLHGHESHFRL